MIIPTPGGRPAFVMVKGEKWNYLTPRDQGWPLLVRARQYQIFKNIERQAKVNFQQLYLQRQIAGLNSTISPLHGVVSRFTVFRRKLILEGGELHYEVCNGKVFLLDIRLPDGSPGNKISRLYQVKYHGEDWMPGNNPPGDHANRVGGWANAAPSRG